MPRLPRALASSSRAALPSARPQPSAALLLARAPAPTSALAPAPVARPQSTLLRPRGAALSLLPSHHRPSLSPSSPLLSLLAARASPAQVRTAVYGAEYQPSQVRRKRKHGFLVRKKSKAGRRTLARRWGKGRKFLSH
ncbi:39S ribosomal protein L34, mitochondrial [Rhodotorula kratochvilovae]